MFFVKKSNGFKKIRLLLKNSIEMENLQLILWIISFATVIWLTAIPFLTAFGNTLVFNDLKNECYFAKNKLENI